MKTKENTKKQLNNMALIIIIISAVAMGIYLEHQNIKKS